MLLYVYSLSNVTFGVKRSLSLMIEITYFSLPDQFRRIGSTLIYTKISAQEWGDTEIAERGCSVLVMRARYRSAGLILHQRRWTDAGRYHGCNCVIILMGRCKCNCFYVTLRKKARCILHHCIPPDSLSYAQGQHGLHGARVMLSVRIADPLSGRRAGS